MHVSVKTLHAIRALSELAENPGTPHSAHALAEQKYIDSDYLTQILNKLKNAGVLQSKKGPSGGYFLSEDPQSITLGDVIRALEGPTIISPCTKPEHSDCEIIDKCAAQDVLASVADEIDALLDHITLDDIRSSDSDVNLEADVSRTSTS
jgi:Rrf2 family protein